MAEASELMERHSALLMEDGRLSHAVHLAAKQERLLTDPTLPDDVAVVRVKPVGRKLRRAVKKLCQLQTQLLTAEEEVQEGQELLTPALSKWMRCMARTATTQPASTAPVPVEPTPPPHRRLLPQVPEIPTTSGTKRKTPPSRIPALTSQQRLHRRRLEATETPKRRVVQRPSRLPVPATPAPAPWTPEDLMGVTLKPTPATQKKKKTTLSPPHLKSSIPPEALTEQSTQLKKVGPLHTT